MPTLNLFPEITINDDFIMTEFVAEDKPALLKVARRDDFLYAGLNNYKTPEGEVWPTEKNVVQYLHEEALKDQTAVPRKSAYLAIRPTSGEKEGEAIGAVEFLGNNEDGSTELAYWMHPEYQGLKLTQKAICAALPVAIDKLKIQKMWGSAAPENHSSQHLLEKLGFYETGRTEDGEEHFGLEGQGIRYDARITYDVDMKILQQKIEEMKATFTEEKSSLPLPPSWEQRTRRTGIEEKRTFP